jgi:hypothetical protein
LNIKSLKSVGKTFKKKNGMIAQMLIRSDKGSLATNVFGLAEVGF